MFFFIGENLCFNIFFNLCNIFYNQMSLFLDLKQGYDLEFDQLYTILILISFEKINYNSINLQLY